jgi:hypothetical protein
MLNQIVYTNLFVYEQQMCGYDTILGATNQALNTA